ncbi:MAG TPA: glycosyltransferase family 2 protein, partial [Anaeromyxobacteraceae bacterium]|nr:glycosyltransferase family 2 protein [Anaeromyxobacteraceae bacterium]
MQSIALVTAVATLLAWALLARWCRLTQRAVVQLSSVPPDPSPPAVSVVVPCRDEAREVERAVRSLLAQDLPELQVVAVDDRSTDGTGEILDRLAALDERLTVVHVNELPAGWLGKNHACAVGARAATGEWILFTDGDVAFDPGAVRRAVAFARSRGLGHLAAAPRFVAAGMLERAFVGTFTVFASAGFRVWELDRAGTRAFVGVGAFNLVRRDAYQSVGGHERLALEVLDDVKLGLLLRRSGVPQGFAGASELAFVRWQPGFVRSVAGLLKNAFAAVEYRPVAAIVAGAALLLVGAAPPAIALLGGGSSARVIAAVALAVAMITLGLTVRGAGRASGVEGVLAPAMTVVLGLVLLTSTAVALARGAV